MINMLDTKTNIPIEVPLPDTETKSPSHKVDLDSDSYTQSDQAALMPRKFLYLKRLEGRREVAAIKRHIVFGMVIGWAVTLYSLFKYRYVPNVNDTLWYTMIYVGIAILAISILVPTLLDWPERIWMFAARIIGKVIFTTMLTVIYYLLITPIGLIWKALKGSAPFYSWDSTIAPANMEGWVPKTIPAEIQTGKITARKKQRYLLTEPARVVGFFIRQGHYILLPTIIIIIMLGLLMFFVQSSTLAPFIYTLF